MDSHDASRVAMKRAFAQDAPSPYEDRSFLPTTHRSERQLFAAHLRNSKERDRPHALQGEILRFFREVIRMAYWNVNKSRPRQEDLFEKAGREGGRWHFIALQEASAKSSEISSRGYEKVECAPLDDGSQPVWWYVRKDVDKDHWKVANLSCGCEKKALHDRLISSLRVDAYLPVPVYLHNVYNWQSCLPPACMEARTEIPGLHIMVGDFNQHSYETGGDNMTQRPDAQGTEFVQLMKPHMKLVSDHTAGGTFSRPQYPAGYKDVIDQAWFSLEYLSRFKEWKMLDWVTDATSDHKFFEMSFNLEVAEETSAGRLWDKGDDEKIYSEVEAGLTWDVRSREVHTKEQVLDFANDLSTVLSNAAKLYPNRQPLRPGSGPEPAPEVKDARDACEADGARYRAAKEQFSKEHAPYINMSHESNNPRNERDSSTAGLHHVDEVGGINPRTVRCSPCDKRDNEDSVSVHGASGASSNVDAGNSDSMNDYDYPSDSDSGSENGDAGCDQDEDEATDDKIESKFGDDLKSDELQYTWQDLEDEDSSPSHSENDDDSDSEWSSNAGDTFEETWDDADDDTIEEDNLDHALFDEHGRYQPDFRNWSLPSINLLGRTHQAYAAEDQLKRDRDKWKESTDLHRQKRQDDATRKKRQKLNDATGVDVNKSWRSAKSEGKSRPPAQFAEIQTKDGTNTSDPKVISDTCMNTWWPDWQKPSAPNCPRCAPPLPTPKVKYTVSQTVTEEQVRRLIRLLKIRKAPGWDGIPNELLKLCQKLLVPHLTLLFNACFLLEYFPEIWTIEYIIAIEKKGRQWKGPADSRPISLLSCLGKLLEALLAMRITELALKHDLVPKTQFGSSRRSTVSALIYLLEIVRAAWARKKAVTILSLDLSSAFPRTDRPALLNILRSKGFPDWVVNILQSFFTNREVRLRLPGHKSELLPLNCGIPQGSPLSPILFALFSSGLLDIDTRKVLWTPDKKEEDGRRSTRGKEQIFMFSYVDDTYIIAISDTYERNNELLERAHEHPLAWAKKHNAVFSPEKYQCLHLSRNKKPPPDTVPNIPGLKLIFDEKRGVPNTPMKIVGVTINSKLRWDDHVETMRCKANYLRRKFKKLAGTSWGPQVAFLRRIYLTSIRPTFTYAAAAWYMDNTGSPATKCYAPCDTLMKRFEAIQNHYLRLIAGAIIGTPTIYAQSELHVESLKAYVGRLAKATRARLIGTPVWDTIVEARTTVGGLKMGGRPNGDIPTQRTSPAKELDAQAEDLRERAFGPDGPGERKEACIKRAINKTATQDVQDTMEKASIAFRAPREQREPRRRVAILQPASNWGPHNLERYEGLMKHEAMVLFQMRTEAIGMRAHLFRILGSPKIPNARCNRCHAPPKTQDHEQTVRHAMFDCKATNFQDLHDKAKCNDKITLLQDPAKVGMTAKWAVENLKLKPLEWVHRMKFRDG